MSKAKYPNNDQEKKRVRPHECEENRYSAGSATSQRVQQQQPQLNFNPLMLMMMCQQMKSMMNNFGTQQPHMNSVFNFQDNCLRNAADRQWPQQLQYPNRQIVAIQTQTANHLQLQTPLKPKTILSVDDSPQDSPILTVESDESISFKSEAQQFSLHIPSSEEDRRSHLGSSEKQEAQTRVGDSLQHTGSKKEVEFMFSQKSVVTGETLSDDYKMYLPPNDNKLGFLPNNYTEIDIQRYVSPKPLNN